MFVFLLNEYSLSPAVLVTAVTNEVFVDLFFQVIAKIGFKVLVVMPPTERLLRLLFLFGVLVH